ncbi:glycosyltransferase family 4 protein [Falsiroseomonas oryzae]|uniref:glycosyltransferase family 4 protein n=1 Tax=Falsiroseomonas oryzae TaxID=2766473 RepID=UPI0022EA93B6|nr:glycosyltransferase family 4 protein [Roseomonas sp. MO-31]
MSTNRPLRILLWYWGRRGGGAQFALGLARALAVRADAELRLSLSAEGELVSAFRDLGVPTQLISTYRGLPGFVASIPRIPSAGRRLAAAAAECDVVLSAMTHLWTPFVAGHLRRSGVRFVPVIHDAAPHPGDFSVAWQWRLNRELSAADAAVVLSGTVAAALQARRPDLPQIRMPLPALLLGSPASRPAASGRFVFFGRFRHYKGLDLLRDAFARLRARHPHITLRVVGEGDAEGCAPGLTGLPGVTVESRWVAEAEIPDLLADAAAVVLPYREASQSGVVPQALALGVPVVATPVGGLLEQVRQGSGGVLATAVTPAALAEAMEAALDPARAQELRREALVAGRALTDWNAAATHLVAELRRAVFPV